MTNTRITGMFRIFKKIHVYEFKQLINLDVEILENRYPVILNKFSIRKSTGGPGR